MAGLYTTPYYQSNLRRTALIAYRSSLNQHQLRQNVMLPTGITECYPLRCDHSLYLDRNIAGNTVANKNTGIFETNFF